MHGEPDPAPGQGQGQGVPEVPAVPADARRSQPSAVSDEEMTPFWGLNQSAIMHKISTTSNVPKE